MHSEPLVQFSLQRVLPPDERSCVGSPAGSPYRQNEESMKIQLRQSITVALLLSGALLVPFGAGQAQTANDADSQWTLPEFRSLVARRQDFQDREKAHEPMNFQEADRVFVRLLVAQGRIAVSRQSQDRLLGWMKVMEERFEVDSLSALDLEMIRLAEARMRAEAARYTADRNRTTVVVNTLLGRAASAPVIAVFDPPSTSSAAMPSGDFVHHVQVQGEEELLPQGSQLLEKLYESYMFGGIRLSELLWNERQVYQAERDFLVWLARRSADSAGQESKPVSE
jgi:hypothetical protein